MNTLPWELRLRIIASLVEGLSMRAISRMLERPAGGGRSMTVHRDTIARLAISTGEACMRFHDERVRNVESALIEADEIWTFVQKKQRRLATGDDPSFGDQYTFVALGSTNKLAISYLTGKRTYDTTLAFAHDLRSRVLGAPQINTDGFSAYRGAFEEAFGSQHHHGIAIKEYEDEGTGSAEHRYAPGRVKRIARIAGAGTPDAAKIGTSFVERQNLTMRMGMRRFTRLSNGFSKRLGPLQAAVALHFAYYNWCRVHETLRVTPAMAAGLADHVWSLGELVQAAFAEPEDAPVAPPPMTPGVRPKPALRLIAGGRG